MSRFRIIEGDCIESMAAMDAESVDAVVTDPPYGINFMGNAWDGAAIREAAAVGVDHTKTRERSASMHAGSYDHSRNGNRAFQVWTEAWALAAMRVLKPGGHLLSFASPRTYHRMTVGIEDAGFEIRDMIMWLYGSGFPKSHAVDKHIDRTLGAVREPKQQRARDIAGPAQWKVEQGRQASHKRVTAFREDPDQMLDVNGDEPATLDAAAWRGWGTALKPAVEPIVVARKPLVGTVAANVLEYGTGAINIDGCRVGTTVESWPKSRTWRSGKIEPGHTGGETGPTGEAPAGRWPANVMLDGEAALELDDDAGAAVSRFFYVAKPGTAERSAGLDRVAPAFVPTMGNGIGGREHDPETATLKPNTHPTVKPITLMRELVRLVTPPAGLVLDPFAGSGTTGIAALLEGFRFVGCELSPEYAQLARRRIAHWNALPVAEQDRIEAATGQQLDLLGDLT